ncbi:MAG TPA: lysine-sensitive aspartokinase 3 [Vicinamibacterales bacterium]|jgi:aspartate kinase
MRIVVMKFGGSSVADADAIRRVIAIVRRERDRGLAPVVVVSALSGVTDKLLACAGTARSVGGGPLVRADVEALWQRHLALAHELLGDGAAAVLPDLSAHFDDLRSVLEAVAILRDSPAPTLDTIAAVGELLSSRLVAESLTAAGVPARWVDAREIVVTDASHGSASPLLDETRAAAGARVLPILDESAVPVLGGFVGATVDGVTTTLGRGGSDYSAAIIGAAVDAHEIQIWTDVDGMLTADPRLVEGPHVVDHLSFGEASELAYFGAKVLHPSTILPAMTANIPVRILNSRRPDTAGTRIIAAPPDDDRPLAAIACKRSITVIDLTSTRMLMAHGFLSRVFDAFERHRTAVDVVTTSEVSVSVTVDDDRQVPAIVDSLRECADVNVERNMAILCAVGDNLRARPGLAARIVGTLDGFPIRMVSQAASRRNLTVVLAEADLQGAMARLHEEFFAAELPAARAGAH